MLSLKLVFSFKRTENLQTEIQQVEKTLIKHNGLSVKRKKRTHITKIKFN